VQTQKTCHIFQGFEQPCNASVWRVMELQRDRKQVSNTDLKG